MKTAVSVPDDLFNDSERLRKKLRCSRSQLYQNAIREYVNRYDQGSVIRSLNAVLSQISEDVDSSTKSFVQKSAKDVLRRSEW